MNGSRGKSSRDAVHASVVAFVRVLAAVVALAAITASGPVVQAQRRAAVLPRAAPLACPQRPSSTVGRDFQGRTLERVNFSRMDLTNADFRGAILKGATFIGANLTGADFSGASFVDAGAAQPAADFSFARLDSACFVGAKFGAATYLTYATLTCTDFSQTDLSGGNAIFGDEPLRYDASAGCRTAFRQTVMNCEFVDQWRAFDLSDAVPSACQAQLAGRDFTGARMPGVNLAGMVIDGATLAGADLSRATLDGASLQCASAAGGAPRCVDLSGAKLQGASLRKANLSGASLYGAFLSNDITRGIDKAASLRQAHLKNVNLAFAQLSGADLELANFYGGTPSNPGGCKTTAPNGAGFTVGCASAHKANLSGSTLDSAYLYGVDFSGADIRGGSFDQAVLGGADFSGATIGTFTPSGSRTKFTRAHLQGTNLDQAATLDADLTDAFVDFRPQGNLAYFLLSGANHNAFACPGASACTPPAGRDVCVWVRYPQTTLPAANTAITCPDGLPAGSGCGSADPGSASPRWKSSLTPGAPPNPGPPPAWYVNGATFTPQTSDNDVICGGLGTNPRVIDW